MDPRSIARLLVILTGVGSAQAGISFQPHESEYTVESMTLKQLAFPIDGGKEATYKQPRNWDYSGAANQLTLHPPARSQAEATISKAPLAQPAIFNDATCQKLAAEALTMVPQGSSEVTVISQTKNPLHVSGKDTFLVILSYKLLGQAFNRSILFLNRDYEQLRFQFVARAADFNELQNTFQKSLCSWRNL